MGQVKDVVEPSAPEMEEWRFDEQVGVEGLLVLEASAPPRLKPHLVESWWKARRKIKTWQQFRRGATFFPGCGARHALLLSSGSSNESTKENTVCFSKEEFKMPHEGHEDSDVG